MNEIKWIFRRTLLFFVTTIGALALGLVGLIMFLGGFFSGKGWAVAVGLILGLGG
jgi:hypothetical protein